MEEEKYQLTPKGIFSVALKRVNLVDDVMDWRIDAAWSIFQLMMEQNGYVDNEGDE
jgi:hypothetical protein